MSSWRHFTCIYSFKVAGAEGDLKISCKKFADDDGPSVTCVTGRDGSKLTGMKPKRARCNFVELFHR